MKRKHVILIGLGVLMAHLALFWALSDTKPLPKRKVGPPPPNFVAKEKTFVDEETGERLTVREFKVSTRLSDPRPRPQSVTR